VEHSLVSAKQQGSAEAVSGSLGGQSAGTQPQPDSPPWDGGRREYFASVLHSGLSKLPWHTGFIKKNLSQLGIT